MNLLNHKGSAHHLLSFRSFAIIGGLKAALVCSVLLLPLQGEGRDGDGFGFHDLTWHRGIETHPHPNPPLEGEGIYRYSEQDQNPPVANHFSNCGKRSLPQNASPSTISHGAPKMPLLTASSQAAFKLSL